MFAQLAQHLATLIVGLMAGLYLGWAISVLPGLRPLDDRAFLTAFQQMNRSILNPAFKALFLAAFLAGPLMLLFGGVGGVTLAVAACLMVGHGGVTAFGNIPLNQRLDALALTEVGEAALAAHRTRFEGPWMRWHWVRTTATIAAFVGLLAAG